MSLQSAMLSKDVSFDSVISSTLHRDPSGTYSKMDARSKAQYHEAIRRLSVVARTSERAVADMAVALAEGNLSDSELERRHAGYYLLCEGQTELLGSLDAKGDPASFWRRMSIASKQPRRRQRIISQYLLRDWAVPATRQSMGPPSRPSQVRWPVQPPQDGTPLRSQPKLRQAAVTRSLA